MMQKFPVITLTGTRQCGKSTLLKNIFPDFLYVSLEDPDMRLRAQEDPRAFLNNFKAPLIIDEAQYVPSLFSYIQTLVDSANTTGMYVLSGSHNFLLMQGISQSLAGRTAVLKLAPFSIHELKNAGMLPASCNDFMFKGGFPRIYDRNIDPSDFFPSYIQTYLERDVRLLRNISDITLFVKFLRLCAGRIGQILSVSSLSNECGISVQTVNAWLSVLETSYVIFFLPPYYNNFNKRLVKSPKLYFYDTGLVCSLLGLDSAGQIALHYARGQLFENMVVAEYSKSAFFTGKEAKLWFWRDNNHNEIDLLYEKVGKLYPVEIKSGETMQKKYFDTLLWFQKTADLPQGIGTVIYGGDSDYTDTTGSFVSWKNISGI